MYDPQEDSFLMAEAIMNLKPKGRVLDLGTGNGILAEQALKTAKEVIAVDKDKEVVTFVKSKYPHMKVKESNYFSNVEGKFDLIINNPPYLPNDSRIKDLALDGGDEGWEFIDNMLSQAKKYLNIDGKILICFANLTNIDKVKFLFKKYGYDSKLLNEKELGIEILYIYLLQDSGWNYLAEGKRNVVQKKNKLVRKWTKFGKQNNLFIEADILKEVNKVNIGPKFISYKDDILIMTYIEGLDYHSWIKGGKLSLLPKIILSLLNQAFKLDMLGVDKSEFTRPYTNIKIGKKIVLLDFERARKIENPKNLQQLCSFIENKFNIPLKDLMKNYSKHRDKKSFNRIKKKISLKIKFKPEYYDVWEEMRKFSENKKINYEELIKKTKIKNHSYINKIINKNPFIISSYEQKNNTFLKKLNERSFNAIKNGKKNIEIRANKNIFSENSINLIKKGNFIIFKKIGGDERLKCVVERKTLYKTIRELLEVEGTKYTLSSTNDIEEGIKSVESINNYKEQIEKNGVFAIKLNMLKLV